MDVIPDLFTVMTGFCFIPLLSMINVIGQIHPIEERLESVYLL